MPDARHLLFGGLRRDERQVRAPAAGWIHVGIVVVGVVIVTRPDLEHRSEVDPYGRVLAELLRLGVEGGCVAASTSASSEVVIVGASSWS